MIDHMTHRMIMWPAMWPIMWLITWLTILGKWSRDPRSCDFNINNSENLLFQLLLLFFRLKSTCSLRLWCFTHHATSSKGTSIMVGFVYLLLAYSHATSLLIFYFFPMSPSSYPFASFKQEIKKYEMSIWNVNLTNKWECLSYFTAAIFLKLFLFFLKT